MPTMTAQNVTSANIRAEVARAGRSQRDVAAAAGITRGRWYARMNRPEDWTVGELGAIARVLGVSVRALTEDGAR